MIQEILRVNCDKKGIERAFEIINRGGIAIFPTDTTYGIGCNPYNNESIKKIYEIKFRDSSKPLPVLVYSKEIAEKIVFFDELSLKFAKQFWPGPLTLVLSSHDKRLKNSLGVSDKIAVRVPNHKCTLELLKKCSFLVGTSANISGQSSSTDPVECFKNMQDYDVFVDGGPIISKGESTIIEIEDEKVRIIREGALSRKEILQL
ncbi:MAG: L-threonylcarbamoyladenylate synthase [Nitrosopumilus sp.]